MTITREQAKEYVSYCVDDALNTDGPVDLGTARLIGWQCGFEPMFVAVYSYLPGVILEDDEAIKLATDILIEKNWFGEGGPTDPDYVI